MSASVSLISGDDVVFSLILDISLTVGPAQVCFGLSAGIIGFERLIGGSVVWQACSLILICSSKVADLDEEAYSSAYDS